MKLQRDLLAVSLTGLFACSPSAAPEFAPDPLETLRSTEAARAARLTTRPDVNDWRRRVIYFTLVDRFANGSAANDSLNGHLSCNDALNPHAFQGGDLAGLQLRLNYIQELGADALWITPLYRGVPNMAGQNCGFPGYWADFVEPYQLELDPRYGTASEFDSLLTELHQRGMPLMLDMVVNHVGYGARLHSQRPGWFTNPHTCAQQGSPDIYCELAGLPDFDHRVPAVRQYLVNAHLDWLRRFDIDAIRMDTVKHVTPEYFREWTSAMRREEPGMYMVGELLDEHSFHRFGSYLNSGFDGLFNFPLRRSLIETFAQGHSVDIAAGRMAETISLFGMERTKGMVNLLDNHDVRRFLEEIPHHVSGPEAQERYALAMSALLTLPGVPQIYYGNELGMYGGHDPHNRRFMPTWAFSGASRAGHRPGFLPQPDQVFNHVQRLLRIRQRMPALQDGNYQELWRQNGPQNNNVWAYLRSSPGSAAIVAHNNGYLASSGNIPLQLGNRFANGTIFRDILNPASNISFTVQNGQLPIQLAGRASLILVPDSLPNPMQSVLVPFAVVANTQWGQSIFVTGSTQELGAWDLNQARPLVPSNCQGSRCTWTGQVAMSPGQEPEFKFVKIDQNLSVQWEQGFNRRLQVGSQAQVTGASFRQ